MPNPKVDPPSPPKFLSDLPKAVVRALDVSQVLQAALTATKNPDGYGPVIALGTIESYFDAAKRQHRRIERAKTSISRSFSRPPAARPGKNLFYDVHFCLISWARIYRLAEFIRDKTRFSRTGLVIRRFRSDLKDRSDARDHLEHFEERLPGGKKRSGLADPNDLLNMIGDYLTYGGRRVDIGPASIRLLKTIRDEFFDAVLFDSIEVLAEKDQRRLSLLFGAANSKVQVARAIRKATTMLKTRAQQTPPSGSR